MSRLSSTAPRPPRVLFLVLAVGLIGLLGMIGTVVWMASSWDIGGMGGMMGSDHMSRMMGGGRDASGDPSRQGTATETIAITDFAYSPGNLQVPVGARVTWTNRDSAPHSATDSGGSWDTGVLAKGKSATLTFDSAGTFDYFCTLHPSMKARLVVR